MATNNLSIKDLRRIFAEKIGFPLIKANATRFVSHVGDLRCFHAVKEVFDAAMRWLAQQQYAESKVKELEKELEVVTVQGAEREQELVTQLEILKEECNELRQQLEAKPDEPEQMLAEYILHIPESEATRVLSTILYGSGDSKEQYYRLAKAFHPDTSHLPEDKATELFKLLSRLADEKSFTYYHELQQPRYQEEEFIPAEPYLNADGLPDIPF